MPEYDVEVQRVDVWKVTIDAKNAKEALRRVRAGRYDMDDTYFSHHAGDRKVGPAQRTDAPALSREQKP